MMRSLFAGVAGLKSHTTRMDVIGNNISNINTIGFKSSRATFSDLLSQTQSGAAAPSQNTGGVNPRQIGLGAQISSVDLLFTDGSPQATGKNTDLALSGNGLFVLKNGDSTYYSRDGAFEFDTNGNFVLPGSGLYVQGWNATEGTLDTSGEAVNIVVRNGQQIPATATTSVDYTGNINAAAPTITGITYTAGGGTADPEMVLQFKNVDYIEVLDAKTFTYDARTMTPTFHVQHVENDQIIYDTVTTENAATLFANGFENGKVYATSGQNATVEGINSDTEYTINRINYNVNPTVTLLKDSSTYTVTDTRVVLTLSNGVTVTISGDDLEDSYTIAGAFSDTTAYNATDYAASSGATITGITVTDSNNGSTKYPATISYSAGNSVKLHYTDNSIETISSGSYSVGERVFNSVNVDGVNVIAATLTLSDGSTQKVTSGYYERNHSVPITTVIKVYDAEGHSHAVTVLIDKDSSSTDENINADALALARVVDDDGNRINFISLVANTVENLDGTTTVENYTWTKSDGTQGNATLDQVIWDNRWRVYMAPTTGVAGPTYKFTMDEDDGSITSGYLNVTLDSDDNPVDGYPSYIYFNEDGTYSAAATAGSALYTVYSNGNGATPTTSALSYNNTTQYAGNTTVYGISDGNATGVLNSVSIDGNGIISGNYSNGMIRTEAQIAVAQFVNSAGLTKVGTSLYQESNNSGQANVKTVETFGLTITPSALEMSNVELASELADMIVTQRGFQSNSKIITVGDEMLETLVNMKR